MQSYNKRKIIRIVGIKEDLEGPRPTEFISKLLLKIFGDESFNGAVPVEIAHRSSFPKPAEGDKKPPRPFIVKLQHFQTKQLILRLAREKGSLTYDGSRIHIFPEFTPEISKRRAAFSEAKEKLHAAKIKFGLYYPATLQFTHNKKHMKFTDPSEAIKYITNNMDAAQPLPASEGEDE